MCVFSFSSLKLDNLDYYVSYYNFFLFIGLSSISVITFTVLGFIKNMLRFFLMCFGVFC